MKKAVVSALLFALLLGSMLALPSCGKPSSDAPSAGSPSEDAAQGSSLPTAFTYRDAYELFKDVYQQGTHAEYLAHVNGEAEKMKAAADGVYHEIIDALKAECESVVEYGHGKTSDEYYRQFVAPYEEYYLARLEMADRADEAYAGVSSLMTFGGNAGADCTALWRYVYYRNLYDELCGMKAFAARS